MHAFDHDRRRRHARLRRSIETVLSSTALALLAATVAAAQPLAGEPRPNPAVMKKSASSNGPIYGLGHAVNEGQIASWSIDVAPDGVGLPTGSGRVEDGRTLYVQQCAACHGAKGEGGLGDALAGGQGSLASSKPLRTVGSYWPYATTLFDYIRRAMPLNAPQSLSAEQAYAVSGYVLHLNGLLDADARVDAGVLTKLQMPNRNGFVADPRPDVGRR